MFDTAISLSPTRTKFGPLLFSGDLDKGLGIISELGYQYAELSLLNSNRIDRSWLIDNLKKHSLKISALATGQSYYTEGYSLFCQEKLSRTKTVERLKGHIDLAAVLNCMVIIGGIRGKLQESDKMESIREWGMEALFECLEYAKHKNVTLLIEPINRYETNLVNTLEEGIQMIKELGTSNLKLLPDTFHMNIEESSFEKSLIGAREYIGYMHFADSNRYAPGLGHIDFKSIISLLIKIGYKGIIGIEVLPVPDDYVAAKTSIDFVKNMNKI